MASSLQPTAASAPLGTTLFAKIILHTIKVQPLPEYKGVMDYEVIKSLDLQCQQLLCTDWLDGSQLIGSFCCHFDIKSSSLVTLYLGC